MADDPAAALIAETFGFYNEAFRTGDVDRARLERFWRPDARHVTRFAALEGRAYDGYEGIQQFITESREQFERFDVVLERIAGDGDRRVAVYKVDALTRETGIPIEQRLGMEIELRDGRLYRTRVHADPRQAFEAVGLDPESA